MARNFVRASNQRIAADPISPMPVTDYPVTLAGWFQTTTTAQWSTIIMLTKKSAAGDDFFVIGMSSAGAARAGVRNTTTGNQVGSLTTSADTWTHVVGTFASSTLREVFFNGTADGTETTAVTFPDGMDEISIGEFGGSGGGDGMNGTIAEVGVWDVVLTDGEALALANGATPNQIRPSNLVGYWPLWGAEVGKDLSGKGNHLTNEGTTIEAFHSPTGRHVNHPSPHAERRVRSTDDALILDRIIPS